MSASAAQPAAREVGGSHLTLALGGERSRALIRLLRRAGSEGMVTPRLAAAIGVSERSVLGLVAKLKHRHGVPIENLVPWPPGRGKHARYRLMAPVRLAAPQRVRPSRPGHAPCRCREMRPGRCCPRCIMVEAWASGRYRRSRPSIRPDIWTPDEDAFLAGLVGLSEVGLADAFRARFGFKRTGGAIRSRMSRLGHATQQRGWTVQSLARLFGVTPDRVLRAWLRNGLLRGAKGAPARQAKLDGTREQWWRVADADVERFIRAYPWEYDRRAMRPEGEGGRRLAQVALDVARRDAYLSVDEAARTLGLPPARVASLVRSGALPARRVTPAWGTTPRGVRIAAADVGAMLRDRVPPTRRP